MAQSFIKVVTNSYGHLLDDGEFSELLERLIDRRAQDIEARHSTGEYIRSSMGFVMLDPTAPSSIPSEDAVLAYFTVGEEGEPFVINALAKACQHRDHHVSVGTVLFTQPHRLAEGDFRWGHSAEIEGTIVGSSGVTVIQDRHQAQLLAAEFNYEVAKATIAWVEAHASDDWFSNENEPKSAYLSALKRDHFPA